MGPLPSIFYLCVNFTIRLKRVYLYHLIPKLVNSGDRVQTAVDNVILAMLKQVDCTMSVRPSVRPRAFCDFMSVCLVVRGPFWTRINASPRWTPTLEIKIQIHFQFGGPASRCIYHLIAYVILYCSSNCGCFCSLFLFLTFDHNSHSFSFDSDGGFLIRALTTRKLLSLSRC